MVRPALLALSLAACGGGATTPSDTDTDAPASTTWRAVLMADTHVIASYYTCCESPGLDTISIYRGADRFLWLARQVNALTPRPAMGFVLGDVFHANYHYGDDLEAYKTQESAAGNAAAIVRQFDIPIHLAWGNHDYEVPEVSAEFSHTLFRELFAQEPYQAITHRGFRFLVMNSQLGATWDPSDPAYARGTGSFGKTQLQWASDQLAEGIPTFLMFHHHPLAGSLAVDELSAADAVGGTVRDIYDLVDAHADTVQAVFAGHLHRWTPPEALDQFTGNEGVPWMILGAVRYDGDSFWMLELDEARGTWEIIDSTKAVYATTETYPATYDAAGATVDLTANPAFDPALATIDREELNNGWQPPADGTWQPPAIE